MTRRREGGAGRDAIGVAVLDAEGRIRSADRGFARLVGTPVDGLLLQDLVLDNQRELARLIAGTASERWQEAYMGLRPDADGVPIDHVVRYRRTVDGVAVVIAPATDSATSVSRALLALVDELIETERRLEARTQELEQALDEVRSARLQARKLDGILPLCMGCGLVRTDDDSEWVELAAYLSRSGAVRMSHGLCPACETGLDGQDAGT
jgi:hypothetical protein